MAIITASSEFHLSPFGDGVSTGTFVSTWRNRITGYCYMDSVPLIAQVLVFNTAINELLGSAVSAPDGSWSINTIPKKYENSPLVAIEIPVVGSLASPQIKTGIYPVF